MSVAQMFPKTVEEFMEEYKMVDEDHVYSNGIEYVPIFRMKQWFEHISKQQTKQQATVSSECVSRQKAKDAIDMALDHIDHVPPWVYDKLLNALNEVPSVIPTYPTLSNTLGALDCVSRQDAIDAIYKEWDGSSYDGDGYHIASECERVLDELPSVQPRKGKWIDYSDEGYVECPFCHSATNCDGNKDELHYCFSCGADMREGDAE